MKKGLDILTPREKEIVEYLAWGASKKQIPYYLSLEDGGEPISVATVETLTKRAYEKIGVHSVAELSAWYFCNRFHISMSLSPLRRAVLSFVLLLTLIPSMLIGSNEARPVRPSRTGRRHELIIS